MTLTIEMAAQLVTLLVVLGGFAFGMLRWVLAQLQLRDQAIGKEREERLLALTAESTRAKLAEDLIAKALADHKLYAAENFATAHELANALGRVEASIERLAERLDKILMDKKP